jgi:hypothetical protein
VLPGVWWVGWLETTKKNTKREMKTKKGGRAGVCSSVITYRGPLPSGLNATPKNNNKSQDDAVHVVACLFTSLPPNIIHIPQFINLATMT